MEAITATYVEHDDDWSVTVTGMGEELTERAPGIIAARDQADQLIESLKSDEKETAVVHLLQGSALEFTTAYMTARLGRTESSDGAGGTDQHEIPAQASGEEAGDAAEAGTAEQDEAATAEADDVVADDSAATSAK